MSDSNKSIRWGYLPDEILTHIFTFLPIKSIIICTSVSKTWKSLIQNPTFISTHLHHSHTKSQNLFLLLNISRNDREVYALHKEDDDPDFTEYTSFESPFHAPAPGFHEVVGTCNGLLCLSYSLPNHANEIFLWNPCVRKFLQLPSPNVTFDTHGKSCKSFGFGFDPKTNDYKVVRILSILRSCDDFGMSRSVVDVYSLSTGEWRMLSASASLPPTCAITSRGPPAFANGALHWIAVANDKKRFVLVFDLGDEVFRQILLPELPSYTGKMMWNHVSAYGNSIVGFQRGIGIGQINIWVMKEYGVASSWTKFSHQCPCLGMPSPYPVGFRRNGEVILLNIGFELVSWNPDSQNIKNLEINGYFGTFCGSYVESLFLFDKATKGVVTY
ncbi:F-box protein CPR1-like isoform X1 [Quercus robur]|uniref:F-box protein CPR1-like isoform X1 n=1 Tax=Quercus robur TaxID=38942 RepID=UPI0021636D4C|nr:F-box protein CPR1-like isoform X1 [Quercus robur]XP_050245778.1 F-box protein CPR1-like isoform X1 [Quercus robur]XP_050245779.1 F-box protein CPR1-like isoform X1 [Quercus robur]